MTEHGFGELHQSPYQQKHSTETALMKVQLDNSYSGTAYFSGVALSWLRNYLIKRSQINAIGITVSKPAKLSRGEPQGSVFGSCVVHNLYYAYCAICKRPDVKYHICTDAYLSLETSNQHWIFFLNASEK